MFGLSVGGTGTRKSPTYLGRVKYVRREDCEFAEIACESMGGSRLITRGFFSSRIKLEAANNCCNNAILPALIFAQIRTSSRIPRTLDKYFEK